MCTSTYSEHEIVQEPRALTGVSARGLRKLALNSGTTGGARKMTQNASKKPFTAAITPLRHHHDLHNRDIGHLKKALQLRDLRSFLHAEPRAFVIENNGHVNNLVQRIRRMKLSDLDCLHTDSTRGICWTCPTVTSTPYRWTATGESRWFSEQSGPRETASAPRQGCRRP